MLNRWSIFLYMAAAVFMIYSTSNAGTVGDTNDDGRIDLIEAIFALQVSSGAYPNIDPSCQLTGEGIWEVGIEYNECDVVTHNGATYACNADHTSSVFDSESVDWTLMIQPSQEIIATFDERISALECKVLFPKGCPPLKQVFITSEEYNGALGGVTGADAKCQQSASNAGLFGTFKAWLSDSTTSPSMTFTQSQVPYRLANGTTIATDWSDLTDGALLAPINVDENGATTGRTYSWSQTKINGSALINTLRPFCLDWTNGTSATTAHKGRIQYTDSNWTESDFTDSCNDTNPLYCFEQ